MLGRVSDVLATGLFFLSRLAFLLYDVFRFLPSLRVRLDKTIQYCGLSRAVNPQIKQTRNETYEISQI